MVQGLDNFKNFFQGFEDKYTLIGGVACHLSMVEAGLEFRATKDLDIVLCAEALNAEFVQKFWDFVKEGEYEHLEKSSGDKQFYRFVKPKNKDFPFMLELFSRQPDEVLGVIEGELTPIPVEEEVSSLSAILLDEGYYQCIKDGKEIVEGVPILKPEFIIPFKMRAWLDLNKRKSEGEKIDSKNIKKHKNDVFRLAQLLSPKMTVDVSSSIQEDINLFIDKVQRESTDLKQLGIKNASVEDMLAMFSSIYKLQ